jgi:hypothetical protein
MYIHNSISLSSSENEKYFRKKNFRENQNTRFMFNNFFSENRAVYVEKSSRARQATDDNIIRRRKDAICVRDN